MTAAQWRNAVIHVVHSELLQILYSTYHALYIKKNALMTLQTIINDSE